MAGGGIVFLNLLGNEATRQYHYRCYTVNRGNATLIVVYILALLAMIRPPSLYYDSFMTVSMGTNDRYQGDTVNHKPRYRW